MGKTPQKDFTVRKISVLINNVKLHSFDDVQVRDHMKSVAFLTPVVKYKESVLRGGSEGPGDHLSPLKLHFPGLNGPAQP